MFVKNIRKLPKNILHIYDDLKKNKNLHVLYSTY